MLSDLHVLLTYRCPLRCKHCFVYGNSKARGTFKPGQVHALLRAAAEAGSIEWIFFEGGEPFLVYPLLLKSVQWARQLGFKVGVITNGYFARSQESGRQLLRPLKHLGIAGLWISDDVFHYKSQKVSPAQRAYEAALDLRLPVRKISLEEQDCDGIIREGSLSSGSEYQLRFNGRAADNLTGGKPASSWDTFTRCPIEDLRNPQRVFVDAYGNVQICQGISIGNIWQESLKAMLRKERIDNHPICLPLAMGGPALLTQELQYQHAGGYVGACHLCFTVRRALVDRFPQYLTPAQVYGLS